MQIAAPTLEDLGLYFWRPDWKGQMAHCLEVSDKILDVWLKKPATIPAGTEDLLRMIGQGRMEEIGTVLVHLRKQGLRR